MFVKRSASFLIPDVPVVNMVVNDFSAELRNGSIITTSSKNSDTEFFNNFGKRNVTALTPSLTMLIIFVIPTFLILFCLCIGYFCRKWSTDGQRLSRFVSRSDEVDSVVTNSAPLTPPPAYPDDKPPSYDEALKYQMTAEPATTLYQSQQRLC